ncbi:MAG: hypothetical protein HRT98_02440 [Mycoplasmatales bacterium]|nr:hypothetical protein [Mycoplasmatales bacterium]
MKIRIVGTGLKKYIDNFEVIQKSKATSFRIEKFNNPQLLDDEDNIILEFKGDNATLKQNLEAWEVMGLVKYRQFKYRVTPIKIKLMEHIKKHICQSQKEEKLEAMRLGYLTLIQHASDKFTDESIETWKIKQYKGKLNSKKLDKQCHSFYKELIEDKVFLAKVRKEIYDEINKEL